MPRITYQYRIYPFGNQAETLERWIDSCRRLYNVALEQRKIVWKMGRKIGYPEQQKELTEVRAAFPEYGEVPVHVLQNVLLRLDRAFENYFRLCKERRSGKKVKPGFPRFKARNRYRSITCPDRYDYIRDGKLHFPKMDGPIRMQIHRPLPEGAVIKSCTISKKPEGWYASFSLEVPALPKAEHKGEAVGIDLGLCNFVTLSTGEKVHAPKFLRASERRLKKAQRTLSRRKNSSNRRDKQREKVALLHARITLQRDDFQWKLANNLARRFSLIAVEDLNVKSMVRNRHLAKSILDAAWSGFIRKLEHAVVKTGSRLVRVDARNSTKTCSACGGMWESLTLDDRVFQCEKCGLALDRDINAARNILRLGRDTPEVTLGETRSSAFRYRRNVRSVEEPRAVPEKGDVA